MRKITYICDGCGKEVGELEVLANTVIEPDWERSNYFPFSLYYEGGFSELCSKDCAMATLGSPEYHRIWAEAHEVVDAAT